VTGIDCVRVDTIRWGIIGCGDVTEVKSGPGFQKAGGSALVAVMRRDGAKAEDYARRHGVPRWYTDAEALIADAEVDAVYVATPPSSHKHYTLLAARAGKPVYVEKPMALEHAECRAMIEGCAAAGVPLFTAYYRRALPRFLRIKTLLDAGAVGTVRAVNVSVCRAFAPPPGPLPWRVDPAISGGGLFVDLASHQLDLLDFFLGPITQAEGVAANQGGLYAAEDVVAATFGWDSGTRGTGLWSFSAWGDTDRTEIVGTRGRILYATFSDAPVIFETDAGIEALELPFPAHVQQPLIQTIVDELLTGTPSCPSTAASAARTTRIIDTLLAQSLVCGDSA
jgi:1,5-anhydro-D-fructose reductase (1,5-anhydro-D-mannitol-forming)